MFAGGDEARVARAGSGRGESSFANGTPSSRGLRPRAGWAVRQNTGLASSSSSSSSPPPTPPPASSSSSSLLLSSSSSSASGSPLLLPAAIGSTCPGSGHLHHAGCQSNNFRGNLLHHQSPPNSLLDVDTAANSRLAGGLEATGSSGHQWGSRCEDKLPAGLTGPLLSGHVGAVVVPSGPLFHANIQQEKSCHQPAAASSQHSEQQLSFATGSPTTGGGLHYPQRPAVPSANTGRCRQTKKHFHSENDVDDHEVFKPEVVVDNQPEKPEVTRWSDSQIDDPQNHQPLELRGETLGSSMTQNAFTPPSRPPSSASSSSSSNNLPARVHAPIAGARGGGSRSSGRGSPVIVGHDHTRPLPPPRLLPNGQNSPLPPAPMTAPLAPLSTTGSFRSNNSRNSTITASTISYNNNNTSSNNNNSSNNIINNTNNNNANNNNNNNNNNTTHHHVQSIIDGNSGLGGSGSSSSSLVSTSASPRPVPTSPISSEVTLTVPRPDIERAVNEYVDTPFRQINPNGQPQGTLNSQKCLKNDRRRLQNHHNQQLRNHHHAQNHQNPESRDQRVTGAGGKNSGSPETRQQQGIGASGTAASAALVSAAHARTDAGGRLVNRSNLLQSSSPLVVVGSAVVTKQPVSFTKEPSSSVLLGPGSGAVTNGLTGGPNGAGLIGSAGSPGGGGGIGGRSTDPSLSIMCEYCGKCRCESCREPPPLPSRWLCDNSCFCSAETVLDYATCLCCVKGLFYHCADSGSGTDAEAGGNCADEPCSCTGPRRTARWACLGALTLVLPCLLCYWPLKGCVTVCEACYARHAAQGCRCDPNAAGGRHSQAIDRGDSGVVSSRDSRDPEKRLLDPVTPDL